MGCLFFMDESGTDQKQMPYEVHGGIVVPLDRCWDLIQSIKDAENRLFGTSLARFSLEIKGERLLQRKVFKHAAGVDKKYPDRVPYQFTDDEERQVCARGFLEKGRDKQPPNYREFRAYGLACLELVDAIFQACRRNSVFILAAAVDIGAPRPPTNEWAEMLRKDLVFLFERLFYLMETRRPGEMSVCVLDQIDDLDGMRCVEGQRLNDCVRRYFTRSHTGRIRSSRILPEPLYVRSDLTTLLGVADLAIYIVNHIFRPTSEWVEPVREELKPYIDWIYRLQWRGQREDESSLFGIFHLSDLRPKGA